MVLRWASVCASLIFVLSCCRLHRSLSSSLISLMTSVSSQPVLKKLLTSINVFMRNCFFFSPIPPAENMKAPLQRSRSRQNINSNSTRAPTAKEPHYESEPHPSAAHRPTHRPEREKEKAREREKEKEQTPTLCSSNGDTDVEALLARLRALWWHHRLPGPLGFDLCSHYSDTDTKKKHKARSHLSLINAGRVAHIRA